MKKMKAVEERRRQYHSSDDVNSVHRASLLVPELPGAFTSISFLNHFLIKRNYNEIGCRLTAVDEDGEKIESKLYRIFEPKVYNLPLTSNFSRPAKVYIVEFFAPNNLFIPFPAVMINHEGSNFLNTVHAFNRVLNDVFEDDAINHTTVPESSIDVELDDVRDNFLLIMSGMLPLKGKVTIELRDEIKTLCAEVPINLSRFGLKKINLKKALGKSKGSGVLRVIQPKQTMFYGRMLVGSEYNDKAFSANHSFYDSSGLKEYWDDSRSSVRVYPYFKEIKNSIKVYPIISPGKLRLTLNITDFKGKILAQKCLGLIKSPDNKFIDVSVNNLVKSFGLPAEEISSFSLFAEPESGFTPTRINHQLIYSGGGLPSSINVSLANPNVFQPKNKKGLAWGQIPIGKNINSWLGIAPHNPDGIETRVKIRFFTTLGEIKSVEKEISSGSACIVELEEILTEELINLSSNVIDYIWYYISCNRSDLAAYTVTSHKISGHTTGEHSF